MRLALQPASYCSAITAAEGEAIKIHLWVESHAVFMQLSHPWWLAATAHKPSSLLARISSGTQSFPSAVAPLRWASFAFLSLFVPDPVMSHTPKSTFRTQHCVQVFPYFSVLSYFIPPCSGFSIPSAVGQVSPSRKSFTICSNVMQFLFISHAKILLSLFTAAVFAYNRNRLSQICCIHRL